MEAINTPTVDTELSDVTIDYTANDQTVIIKFIDDDNRDSEGNSAPIQFGSDITESGKTDSTGTFHLDLPDNYELKPEQNGISLHDGKVVVSYKLKAADNQSVTIYLGHQIKIVDGKDPDNIPSGEDKNHLIHNVTRTIKYTGLSDAQLDQIPADQKGTQTVQFTGTVKYDMVTKKLVAGSETDWTVNGTDAFAGFTAKAFAGYSVATGNAADETKVPYTVLFLLELVMFDYHWLTYS